MKIKTQLSNDFKPDAEEKKSYCNHVCQALPLVCKNFKLKMMDHLLLGGEHTQKISPGFLARFLMRFLASFLTRKYSVEFFWARKYSVQSYRDRQYHNTILIHHLVSQRS